MKRIIPQKTILVIEDDAFLLEIMVTKLKKEGYRVLQGITGEEGIKIAEKEHPDLILLDLILPTISGFEVLAHLRQQDATKAIPVIVCSNYAEQESIKRSKELGAIEYLVKARLRPAEILDHVNSFFKNQ